MSDRLDAIGKVVRDIMRKRGDLAPTVVPDMPPLVSRGTFKSHDPVEVFVAASKDRAMLENMLRQQRDLERYNEIMRASLERQGDEQ